MSKRAIFMIILGLMGLAIGIFAMSPYNETGPYSHIIGGGLLFALLLCGLGILSILLGLCSLGALSRVPPQEKHEKKCRKEFEN